MADNIMKNNAGKIEFYQGSDLVFTFRDDASALYMQKNATTGDMEIKRVSDNSVGYTFREG